MLPQGGAKISCAEQMQASKCSTVNSHKWILPRCPISNWAQENLSSLLFIAQGFGQKVDEIYIRRHHDWWFTHPLYRTSGILLLYSSFFTSQHKKTIPYARQLFKEVPALFCQCLHQCICNPWDVALLLTYSLSRDHTIIWIFRPFVRSTSPPAFTDRLWPNLAGMSGTGRLRTQGHWLTLLDDGWKCYVCVSMRR